MMARRTLFISLLCTIGLLGAAQDRGHVHSFLFRDAELRAALDSLLRWYAVPLIYLDKDAAGKRVNAECSDCGFEEALRKVIEGQELVWRTVGRQVILQKEEVEREIPASTFGGTIRDSLTREGVAAADVLLLTESSPSTESRGLSQQDLSQSGSDLAVPAVKVYRWSSTNQFGFFSLRNIQPGDYILHVRRLGYKTINEGVTITPGSAIVRDIAMLEKGVVYSEITVEGRRSAFSVSGGISRGVYIRATPSDQNQYFLEGARIYNPLHFGGVMSTFNGDALRDFQVVAGGVPPYYGGRIGGILDVVLRDRREEGLTGSAAIGSLGSDLLLEGSVIKGTTFMISGRRGYPDVFFPSYRPWYRTDETPSDLNSSEVIAKLTHHLSSDQRLSLSAYFGRDAYGNQIADRGGNRLSNSIRWGNGAANVRWIGIVSPSLFFYASAIYTRYGFDAEHDLEGIGGSLPAGQPGLPETFVSKYFIEDAAVRAHAEYFYDEYHTVIGGVELVRHRMGGKISEFSSQVAPMSFDGFSPWELSVYLQDQWRLAPSVLAEVGARATSFIAKQPARTTESGEQSGVGGGSFSAVDPRFSLLVSLEDDLRLHSSLSAVNQFVHPYRHSGIFLFYPSIFLYPSSENIQPSTSLQVSLGMQKNLQQDRYRIAFESYYRMTQSLHEFMYDTTMAGTLSDALLLGEGNICGAEVTIDKRLGALTGSIRYGFSWASNRFAELNGGEPFRPRFDRRHELYATVSYSLDENWTLGATCLLSSNQFPSFAASGFKAQDVASPSNVRAIADAQYAEPYDLNGGRLPGFQRLELRLHRRFSWWGFPVQATLRLLNGYGLIDPFVWELRQSPDNRLKWRATFDAPPLFPLYPVVSVGVRF